MSSVVVSTTAERNLRALVETHFLPASTVERFRASLEPLHDFPLLGAQLGGRWERHRYLLGPWRWMLIVYRYDEQVDRVEVVTIRDARSQQSPTADRT